MKRASALFNHESRRSIDGAISAAEKNTSGEIVAVVAAKSGRYDRAEDLFGLVLAFAGLIVWWGFRQYGAAAAWAETPMRLADLMSIIGIVLAGFVFGAALSSRVPLLCAAFISKREMQEEVERRALEMFQRQRVRATAAGTGVLIYVSLFERMVRVIGDDAINARLQASDWEAICAKVVSGMRAGAAARGLEQAIALSGELLTRHFPADGNNRDELPNTLILID